MNANFGIKKKQVLIIFKDQSVVSLATGYLLILM